jgi:hypothetical protein
MKKISRHTVDKELVQEGVEAKKELLADIIESAGQSAGALLGILSTATSYAGYLSAAGAEQEELCRALRTGAQTSAAIFALASGRGKVEFTIGDQHAKLQATGPTDATYTGSWRTGWWMAQIVRDRAAIDQLASTPIEILRRSSTRGDECQYLFVEALQAFENRAADWGTKLQAAVEATDPTRTQMINEEYVLDILVPEMQMLFHLGLAELAPFYESLEFALERHKKYWSKGNRKRDPDGYLALGPLAIASLAYDAGMPFDMDSEYVLASLVEGACSQE